MLLCGVNAAQDDDIEVARNTGDSEIADAQLELTLADLDLEKYRDGDYLVELNDLQGRIALAEVELEKATEALQNTRELVKKGFREPEQIRTAEQTVQGAKFSLERDRRSLDVLKTYDYKRKLTEFDAKAKEAKRKLTRAKSSAAANLKKAENEHKGAQAELKLQGEDLTEAELQKTRCEIKAAQDGVVAYANEEWWSESRRIREYPTIITWDDTPAVVLRPGMTAEVEILIDNLNDVLAVPVQAVAEHRRKHFVYIRTATGIRNQEVEIGQTNNRLIEVTSGLSAGVVVVLDARSRAAAEFADDDGADDNDELLKLHQEADAAEQKEAEKDPDDVAVDGDSADDKTEAEENAGATKDETADEKSGQPTLQKTAADESSDIKAAPDQSAEPVDIEAGNSLNKNSADAVPVETQAETQAETPTSPEATIRVGE